MILSFLIHLTSAFFKKKKKTQKFVCYTVCDPIGTYKVSSEAQNDLVI